MSMQGRREFLRYAVGAVTLGLAAGAVSWGQTSPLPPVSVLMDPT
jgi:hypothetical protein